MYYPSYRAVDPSETLSRIRPFFGAIGITRIANITGLDEVGIPVFIAVRPNSRSMSLSQGKGLLPISAKISALMETIESFHAERIEKACLRASHESLASAGRSVCNLDDLPKTRNADLDPNDPIDWLESVDVLQEKSSLVPYACVETDLRLNRPQPRPAANFVQSSNGLASGNTALEAITHATAELIERDGYACWSVRSASYRMKTKVSLSTVSDAVCCALIEAIQAKAHLGIWDVSSDLGIPTFLARIIPQDGPPLCCIRPASGFGCHPDKNLALIRALTEAAQSRLTFIAGARDDIRLSHYRTLTSASEYNKWHDAICRDPATLDFAALPTYYPQNGQDVFAILKAALQRVGVTELHAVDLTKAEFGIPVFKVILPGLEGGEGYRELQHGPRAREILRQNHAQNVVYA